MVRAAAAGRRVGDVALPPFQLSIGIAVQSAGMTPASFLAAADEAMYAAKRAGGNRINVVGATVVAHGYESSELARGPMVPGRHDD